MTLPVRAALAALSLAALPAAAQEIPTVPELPDPSERQGETIEVNGAEIFYTESGEGPAIVLLHGYPLSGALFSRVTDALDDAHRVITIDHRGYGMSTTPEPVDSVEVYAEDALAVLDELGVESAVVGGMSMGGPIMFEMYEARPGLFRGMIAIDTNHLPAGEIETGIWRGAEDALTAQGDMEAIIPFLIPNMITGRSRVGDEQVVEDYLRRIMRQASLDGAIGGARALANRPDYTETLEGAEVPVLVLVGIEDPVYPVAISQAIADAAPESTLVIIDGASHAAVFEQPGAAAAAMRDWLAGL
jgi:pimeloyl-ACP methyl ester carboxylesterase